MLSEISVKQVDNGTANNKIYQWITYMSPEQHGLHFADDIFKSMFSE